MRDSNRASERCDRTLKDEITRIKDLERLGCGVIDESISVKRTGQRKPRRRRGFPSRIKFYRRYVTEPVTRSLCTCIRSQGNGDEICVALVEFHDHYTVFLLPVRISESSSMSR